MIYYGGNDYRDYLAHHGIKGMHWGIRRYQPYPGDYSGSGRFIGKKSLGTRLGIRAGNFAERNKARFRNVKNAKGIVKKASALAGHDAGETMTNYKSKMHEDLAKASKTKLGQHYHKVAAENLYYQKQYHNIRKNMKLGEKAASAMLFNGTRASQPIKTITGRQTTVGKEVAIRMLTGGFGNLALDAAHLTKTGRKIDASVNKGVGKAVKNENVRALLGVSNSSTTKSISTTTSQRPTRHQSNESSNRRPSNSERLNNARNHDRYDTQFLEKIQNKSYFEGNDSASRSKRLSEYERYLKDPKKYKASGKDL